MKKISYYLALGVCSLTFLGSGIWYGYEQNFGNIKQEVLVQEHKKALSDLKVTDTESFDYQKIKAKVIENDQLNLTKKGVISMPSLDIFLPIYNQPYSQKALKLGAQQLPATTDGNESYSTAGQGNYILVAHNYSNGTQMFSALQQNLKNDAPYLVNGQKHDNNWLNGKSIYIANSAGVYEYQIDKQYIVSMTDLSVTKNTSSSELNILTCLEPSDNYRIVTHGILVKRYSWQNASQQVLKYFNYSNSHRYNL